MRLPLTGRHSGNFFTEMHFCPSLKSADLLQQNYSRFGSIHDEFSRVEKHSLKIIKAPQSHTIKAQSLGES